MKDNFEIRFATAEDVPVILGFIRELAEYEKLSHEVVATEAILKETLFGENSHTEVLIGLYNNVPVGYALFFHSFSTFLGRPGIFLEDLYITLTMRGKGFGKKLLSYLAKLTKERKCGRLEWSVLDWNQPAIDFYKSIGVNPMDEWTVYRLTDEALTDLAR